MPYVTYADLASTDSGKGAALVGVEGCGNVQDYIDTGAVFVFKPTGAVATDTAALNSMLGAASTVTPTGGMSVVRLAADTKVNGVVTLKNGVFLDLGPHDLELDDSITPITNFIYSLELTGKHGVGNLRGAGSQLGQLNANSKAQFSIRDRNCTAPGLYCNLRSTNWQSHRAENTTSSEIDGPILRNFHLGVPATGGVSFGWTTTCTPGQGGAFIQNVDIDGFYALELIEGAHSLDPSNRHTADCLNFQGVRSGWVRNVHISGSGEVGMSMGWACANIKYSNIRTTRSDGSGIYATARFKVEVNNVVGTFNDLTGTPEMVNFSNGTSAEVSYFKDYGDGTGHLWFGLLTPTSTDWVDVGDTLTGATSGATATITAHYMTEGLVFDESVESWDNGLDALGDGANYTCLHLQGARRCHAAGSFHDNPSYGLSVTSSADCTKGMIRSWNNSPSDGIYTAGSTHPFKAISDISYGLVAPLSASGNATANRGVFGEYGGNTGPLLSMVANAEHALALNRTGVLVSNEYGRCLATYRSGVDTGGGIGNLGLNFPTRNGTARFTVATLPTGSAYNWTLALINNGDGGQPCLALCVSGAWQVYSGRSFGVPVHTTVYTVSSLPSAATYPRGKTFVSDADSTTFGATVAGGGTNLVPVYSDGTDWKIG